MQPIILASGSTNRQKLLQSLGIPFKIIVSHFDETTIKATDQKSRAAKIARAKARQVATTNQGIIIACDTFTVCQNIVMEKPKNLAQAKKMLQFLSGNRAICYTGFCLINTAAKTTINKTAVTYLTFRTIYNQEIDTYIKKFPVTSWAAAYAPSELYVIGMIKSLTGSLSGLTHGLPTEFLIPELKKLGLIPKVI